MRVITLARKPLVGSVAENVLRHGSGGLNIEASRVQTQDNLDGGAYAENASDRPCDYKDWRFKRGDKGNAGSYEQPSGRWPSNVILEHRPECKCVGTKKVKGITGTAAGKMAGHEDETGIYNQGWAGTARAHEQCGFVDAEGNEVVTDWECHPECPVKDLDEQSGELHSQDPNGRTPGSKNSDVVGVTGFGSGQSPEYGDSGGASRFFKQVKRER